MKELHIGIIDDDSSKITQIMTQLCTDWQNVQNQKYLKYAEYQLQPVEIPISLNMEDMLSDILEKKVDCIIIDYRLSSYATVNFTGIDLAKAIQTVRYGFPIFVLTSYEEDVYTKEIFDVYQIFNFERYQNEVNERAEINSKIIEQILKYRKERIAWENELKELLPKKGESAIVDARIMELDSYIENSIDGRSALDITIKQQLSAGKVDLLLSKLDEIISKE